MLLIVLVDIDTMEECNLSGDSEGEGESWHSVEPKEPITSTNLNSISLSLDSRDLLFEKF